MLSVAFLLFAFFLKNDRRKAALILGFGNILFYVLSFYVKSDTLYYFVASFLDAFFAFIVSEYRTKTAIHLAVVSLCSCVINGVGYIWHLAYMPAMPYNITITFILVIQMAILLRDGIYDTGCAFCSLYDSLDMRHRVLGSFKGETVQS
jgi:hypothetical protein